MSAITSVLCKRLLLGAGSFLFAIATATAASGADPQVPPTPSSLPSANAPASVTNVVASPNAQVSHFDAVNPVTLTMAGAELVVPANALDTAQDLSVESLDATQVPHLDAGITNVTPSKKAYRFLPLRMRFKNEAQLTLNYDKALLPRGKSESDIRALYYDTATRHWQALPLVSVDKTRGVVISKTTHFTDMIAGTITVPDHATPQSFDPNSMKDMKPASPTAGVNLIQAPSASSQGDANLSYPIELPAGRLGIQPSLRLGYNSSGGNGWLGMGWNMSMPEVAVDTRWGVPRYDASKETETYSMSGSMLVPVNSDGSDGSLPHRTAFASLTARTSEAKFRMRIEGSFLRIIRHGSTPQNYWWDITDKEGTHSYFGGTPEGGADATSVLANPSGGSVSRWPLKQVRDSNGNTYTVTYTSVSDVGFANGSLSGIELYPSSIAYTGNISTGAAPAYRVDLVRDRQLSGYSTSTACGGSNTRRCDSIIDARVGYKTVVSDLLKQINIFYTGSGTDVLARRYGFEYKTGAFAKTLMTGIVQYGSDGSVFNRHDLAYENDVINAGFGSAVTYTGTSVPSDNVSLGSPSILGNASLISGATGKGIGGHFYSGYNPTGASKQGSYGSKLGFDVSSSATKLALIDINGDGKPDKVFVSGGTVSFRLNTTPVGGAVSFGPLLTTTGIGKLGQDSSSTFTFGFEGYPPASNYLTDISLTFAESPSYLTDVNSDGLPDLVDGGVVYFNRLVNGIPTFATDSAATPYPLISAGGMDASRFTTEYNASYSSEQTQRIAQDPLLDSVRRWVAPYTGSISITGTVSLQTGLPADGQPSTPDGAAMAIQVNGAVLWTGVLAANSTTILTPTGVTKIAVNAGDRVYFRVGSVNDGAYDKVNWQPTITYVNATTGATLFAADPNYGNSYAYSPFTDFTPGGRLVLTAMPFTGTVKLTGTLNTGSPNDDLTVYAVNNTQNTIPYQQPVTHGTNSSVATTGSFNVNAGDKIALAIFTDSNVNPQSFGWKPTLTYTAAGSQPVTDVNGNPLITFTPGYYADLYQQRASAPQQAWIPTTSGTATFTPGFSVTSGATGSAALTVKSSQTILIAKGPISVSNGAVTASGAVTFAYTAGQSYFFDISIRNAAFGATLSNPSIKITSGSTTIATLADPQVVIHPPALVDFTNQSMSRGWTMFAWNARGNRENLALDETKLVNPTYPAAGATPAQLQAMNFNDPTTTDWYSMSPSSGSNLSSVVWTGPSPSCTVGLAYQQSSRLGADSVAIPNPAAYAGAKAVERISHTSQTAIGAGGGPVSGSISNATSTALLDFLDLNGDGFPDITGRSWAQYTVMSGGLEAASRGLSGSVLRNSASTANNVGVGVSGNPAQVFADASATVGGNPGLGHGAGTSTPSGDGKKEGMLLSPLGSSFNVGVASTFGSSSVSDELIDINGDGLPDRVSFSNGQLTVALNTGYGFTAYENWGSGTVNANSSTSLSLSGGISYNGGSNYDIAGGINYGQGDSVTGTALDDVNGDGLPDLISRNGQGIQVAFNTGAGFAPAVVWGGFDTTDAHDTSVDVGGGLYFTFGIPVYIGDIVINPGVNVSTNSHRQTTSFRDIDGDGYVDQIQSANDGSVTVARNLTAATNKLVTIYRPLGGRIDLTYSPSGTSFDLPRNRWLLSSVKVTDGHNGDGADTHLSNLAYSGGYYDRYEREFYGFAASVEDEIDPSSNVRLRRTINSYLNHDFYQKGLISNVVVRDGSDHPFTQMRKFYRLFPGSAPTGTEIQPTQVVSGSGSGSAASNGNGTISSATGPAAVQGSVFVQDYSTGNLWYEGSTTPGQATAQFRTYDAYGNVNFYCDAGEISVTTDPSTPPPNGDFGNDVGVTDDDVCAKITYSTDTAAYIVGKPTQIQVTNFAQTTVFRQRNATVQPTTGNITAVSLNHLDGTSETTNLTYNPNGTLATYTEPNGYQLTYTYEPTTLSLISRIDDSFGDFATTAYPLASIKYGLVGGVTDENGNSNATTYDAYARMSAMQGPYEFGGSQQSVAISYSPAIASNPAATSTPPSPSYSNYWAKTSRIDLNCGPTVSMAACLGDYRTDTIDTIIFTDGLGRAVQSQQDARISTNGTTATDTRIVSGRADYDTLGRVIAEHDPIAYPGTVPTSPTFVPAISAIPPTQTVYETLDRPISITNPDQSQRTITYGFGQDRDGRAERMTVSHDELGAESRSYTNVRNLITAVYSFDRYSNQQAWTSYLYDPLNQLTQVDDEHRDETRSQYDALGRRVLLSNPDSGTVLWHYDAQGRLDKKTNPDQRTISYGYSLNRLTQIIFTAPPNDLVGNPQYRPITVSYTYGRRNPGVPSQDCIAQGSNTCGRIQFTGDQSGSHQRSYGKLGEIVAQTDTLIRPNPLGGTFPDQSDLYTTQTIYDDWGRLRKLEYPDLRNNVVLVAPVTVPPTTPAITQTVAVSPGEVVTYGYDSGGKLQSIQGETLTPPLVTCASCLVPTLATRAPSSYLNDLRYDQYGQRLGEDLANTEQEFYQYDPNRRWLAAKQTVSVGGKSQNLTYGFDVVGNLRSLNNNPAAASLVSVPAGPVEQSFRYDDWGRLTEGQGQVRSQQNVGGNTATLTDTYSQRFQYDEADNLTNTSLISTPSATHPVTSLNVAAAVSGAAQNQTYAYAGDHPHAASAVGNLGYTYDANGNRVGSVIAANGTSPPASTTSIVWDEEQRLQQYTNLVGTTPTIAHYQYDDSGERRVKRVITTPTISPTGLISDILYVNPWLTIQKTQVPVPAQVTVPTDPVAAVNGLPLDEARSQYVWAGQTRLAAKLQVTSLDSCTSATTTVPETVLYYHTDHLGSTQYLTDQCATQQEHTEYLPYGQSWVDDTNTVGAATSATTFDPAKDLKFTGKNYDEESGFYYFGARYFDAKAQLWISPDPILDKYMSGGPNGGVFSSHNLSLYSYVLNNPIRFADPDGRATWLGANNLVINVTRDSDLSIYRPIAGTDSILKAGLGGREKIGETYFEDAFISPDTQKPVGKIFVGQDITKYIADLAATASTMSTDAKDTASQAGSQFDVKDKYPGHEGKSYHGFLFGGKYISLREAGNILAGINAKSHGQTFEKYMKGAGAYQQAGAVGAINNRITGKTYGDAPYFGEQDYTGSRVRFGYDDGQGIIAPFQTPDPVNAQKK